MSKVPVCNMQGDRVGDVQLADDLLELKRGAQAVQDAVQAYRAGLRSGTASTRKRGEVSGGGAKPWRQKGTGRARAGTIRSPIWKGGGVVFGPIPRSFAKSINRKVSQLAFCRAFSEKVAAGEVVVVEKIELPEAKTRHVAAMLKKLKADRGALLVVERLSREIVLASRNLVRVEVAAAADVHTYQMLKYPMVVVSKAAMPILEGRLKKRGGKA
ncbi:MAG TPA: 50S ribosomal protein L4 [Kiritimatiellia bacterium]|nr:50S ribosomal protein L4 [Kiritimatiellia bacterium]